MKQAINKIKEKHILAFFIFLILVFSLKYINQLSVPTFLNDEIGYLANAALLSGKDWSGITRISAYYSYGYSIVLVPLFFLIKNTSHLYKAIILLNVFFYIISYYLSFITIKDLFRKIDSRVVAFICGIVSLYSANIYNVNYAWVEPLLYLVFWILIYQMNQIYKFKNNKNILLLSFFLFFMYTIHQRTVGIILVGCLCIICLYINKNIDKRNLLVFFLSIISFIVIGILLKQHIKECLWNNTVIEKLANANEYSGQITKIIAIVQSPKLIWNLIRGIIGKYYYLVISTGSIVTFGIIKIIKEIKITFVDKKQIHVVYLFMLLSLFILMTTSSVFFITAERFDTVLYGRYSEFAMSPLFICGIISFIKKDFSLKDIIINVVILLVAYFSTKGFLSGTKNYIFPCTVNASLFYDRDVQAFAFNKYFFIGIILFFVVYFFMTRRKNFFKIIPALSLIIFWNMCVSSAMEQDKLLAQDNISQVKIIADSIKKNKPIYYIYEGNYEDNYPRWFIGDIQYMIPNRTIYLTNIGDVDKLNNCYIITYGDELKYKQIESVIGYHLYEK